MNKKTISHIKDLFLSNYDGAKTELIYKNDYELLVCIILSAQCTDKRVNIITPNLFRDYPDINSLALANEEDIKAYIDTCSFFNNKAVNLLKMAKRVRDEFGGKIPQNQKDLITLGGVGVKTANVFLGEFLDKNYMAVDTHVFRVAHRLKLSKGKNVKIVQEDLTNIFKTKLNLLHQAMVLFGRYTCKAKNPNCDKCFLYELCSSIDKNKY